MSAAATPTPKEIERALKLVESQRRASKTYYERNKAVIKAKSTEYWESHKDAINARRRERYAVAHPRELPSIQ